MNTYIWWRIWTLNRTTGFFLLMVMRRFTRCPSKWSRRIWWCSFPRFTNAVGVLYTKQSILSPTTLREVINYKYKIHNNIDTHLHKWVTTLESPTSIVPVGPPHRSVVIREHVLFIFGTDYLFLLALCINHITIKYEWLYFIIND